MSNESAHKGATAHLVEDEAASVETWTALALSLEPIAPEVDVRANLVARLAGSERFAPFAADVARVFGVTREAARAALLSIDDAGVWRDGMWPGARVCATPELQAVNTVIARLPAATQIPKHPHGQRELTLVLQGCLIEDGRAQHGPGDVLDMASDTSHAIAVSASGECLVVFSPLRL